MLTPADLIRLAAEDPVVADYSEVHATDPLEWLVDQRWCEREILDQCARLGVDTSTFSRYNTGTDHERRDRP